MIERLEYWAKWTKWLLVDRAWWAVRRWLPWKLSTIWFNWEWDRGCLQDHRLHQHMWRYYCLTGQPMITDD